MVSLLRNTQRQLWHLGWFVCLSVCVHVVNGNTIPCLAQKLQDGSLMGILVHCFFKTFRLRSSSEMTFLTDCVHVPQWCRFCATLRGNSDTQGGDSYVWVCVYMWWMGTLFLVSHKNCTPRSLDSGLSHPCRIQIDAHRSKACHRKRPHSLIWSVCTHRSRLPTVVASERFVSVWATGRNSRLFDGWHSQSVFYLSVRNTRLS